MGDWTLVLERFIMVEEFLKLKSYKTIDVQRFRKWFPAFLEFVKNVVDRQSSTGFKLLKFHLCTHFADDILKWGCPTSYDSSTGESHHKILKRHARRTQRNVHLLVEQTGVRYVEHLAIQQSLAKSVSTGCNHILDQEQAKTGQKFMNKAYVCNKNGILNFPPRKDGEQKASWFDQQQFIGIESLLLEKILPHVRGQSFDIYTSIVTNGCLYHVNPWFKQSSWQDLAYCDWGDSFGICPVHLLAFLDLRCLRKDITIQGTTIEKGYFVAVVHMV